MTNQIEPILQYFENVSAIPRCSKKEHQIADWIKRWSDDKGFNYSVDKAGNLVIRIPATAGDKEAPVVVLQGHLDMVCENTPASQHNFESDPIRLVYDGDWITATDTTLGADNGIAIAMALALADDNRIEHPPLELLFTVDEETGLTGAQKLDPDLIKGRILLNLDSEDEGVFTVGCAGGEDIRIQLPLVYTNDSLPAHCYRLLAAGLHGGHSGIDIDKHFANANKIVARALQLIRQQAPLQLISIKGGSAHNAIPRDAEAIFACSSMESNKLTNMISDFEDQVQTEHQHSDPSIKLTLESIPPPDTDQPFITAESTFKIIDLLLALPHGVAAMSADVQGLVETSNNLATITIEKNHLVVQTSQRSSVMSRLAEINDRVDAIAALAGAATTHKNSYPAWQPNMSSPLLQRCRDLYTRLYKREPVVEIIHAGLECGLIGAKIPDMDLISLGPTIKNPHSPEEKLYIPSVGRIWEFLLALLKSYMEP